ncbi:MAG: hypothetical protein H7Y60_01560 [Rhodospirillaceae bacterium]|nr:hypothetical protein [Rhodospirillales bacterium]
MADWGALAERLEVATGADADLDGMLAQSLSLPANIYTGSVDAARALVAVALPGWHLHVGFDVSGLFPYAAITQGDIHVEATAPTVPLAVLRAALKLADHFQSR